MGGLYHGRILLHWCDQCHVPVLAERCACGSPTRPVPVTPPGDARPAFPDDIVQVNSLFEEKFGITVIPPGAIALLNKVPDKDRMEEVIVGGAVVGTIRYDTISSTWEALARPEIVLIQRPTRRYMIVDAGAVETIRGGASLLAPGLLKCEESVRKGDEVILLSPTGECAGVGRSRVDAAEAAGMTRGQVVRTRKNIPSVYIPGAASWDDAVRANTEVLQRAEAAVSQFIETAIQPYRHLPACVSYSGGKDSLATLLVVMNTFGKVPILYIDTGLEFPETEENVRDVTEKFDLECVSVSSAGEFWDAFEVEGPPAIDHRWCCRVAKLEPLRRFIEEKWGECVSFVGQRKYESFSRMKNPRVWRNSFVKNQVCLAPIHNWTALHVWLYIFREKSPFNRMYMYGLDRMGCFMCPSSDLAILEKIKVMHPDLWKEWEMKMEIWREKNNLPESWVTSGEWRKRGDQA